MPHIIDPSPWLILPFAGLLFSIAISPFLFKHWWEHHYPKVSVGLGLFVALYYIVVFHAGERVGHTMLEYVSFICLIGSLFVVSGGIHITVAGQAKPLANIVFLLVGAILANVIGTTGASMLLLRPWIRMNKLRYAAFHTVFFIFIISNTSGCLTPIGDPPLFLGYLKGVPFWWDLQMLWQPWLLVIGLLLATFFVFDSISFARVPKYLREKKAAHEKFTFAGLQNIAWLALILTCVFLPSPWREIGMAVAAAGSYFTTQKNIHISNHFNFGPIKEVAWLFLGIFATMVPALDYLGVHARELGISSPISFYYFTGALSGVLDNAPTYLTFFAASISQLTQPGSNIPLDINRLSDVTRYIALGEKELIAISLGAVWFGAMTYIGNGPNLMVKAIAEQAGVKAPHFLEYIYKYSLPILLPILILAGTILFH